MRVRCNGQLDGICRDGPTDKVFMVARVIEAVVWLRRGARRVKRRHARAVPAPQRVQLVRDGEDEMMVRAGDQACALALKPLLGGERLALRAAALMARVIERALDVPLRTAAHVAAELGGAAARDPVRRAMHVRGQPMLLRVGLKMRLEYLSERAFHVLPNAWSLPKVVKWLVRILEIRTPAAETSVMIQSSSICGRSRPLSSRRQAIGTS